MSSASKHNPQHVNAMTMEPPTGNAAFLWTTLVEDTAACVIVVNPSGVVEYANETATTWFGDAQGCVGKSLSEIMTADVMQDQLGLARSGLAAGRPVTIDGMCRGRLLRSTFRALPDGPSPRILIVSRLASPAEPLRESPEPGVMRARVDDQGSLAVLTAREMEILKLIGLGLSSAEIARRLDRSVKTVEWHRVSLGDKLNVSNRVELARIAIGAGLVGCDTPRTSSERSGRDED
jgi:DNA-binding CsgD family transcriptional regulator